MTGHHDIESQAVVVRKAGKKKTKTNKISTPSNAEINLREAKDKAFFDLCLNYYSLVSYLNEKKRKPAIERAMAEICEDELKAYLALLSPEGRDRANKDEFIQGIVALAFSARHQV